MVSLHQSTDRRAHLNTCLLSLQQTLSYEKRRDQERDEEAEVRRMERDARKER